MSFFLHI